MMDYWQTSSQGIRTVLLTMVSSTVRIPDYVYNWLADFCLPANCRRSLEGEAGLTSPSEWSVALCQTPCEVQRYDDDIGVG